MAQIVPLPIPDALNSIRTNYVGFASFVVLVWDHVDTFADEVEYVWKAERKGLFVYLFFFNRYFTPLSFTLNLYAYLSPTWTFPTCSSFVRYEGFTVALAVEIVGLMMLMRINAIYPSPSHKWIVKLLGALLLVETIINCWLITRGEPVIHNPASGIRACTMIFDPSISAAAASSAWLPLLYDTLTFILTLNKTLPSLHLHSSLQIAPSRILQRLFEDGFLYYTVIFSVTLVLTIMIAVSPAGVKNIAAQTEQLITVAMMSRITISLKKAGNRPTNMDSIPLTGQNITFTRPSQSTDLTNAPS